MPGFELEDDPDMTVGVNGLAKNTKQHQAKVQHIAAAKRRNKVRRY